MREETREQPAPLRSGLTTGSCATATSLAAARLLLTGQVDDAVSITLPKGKVVQMRLEFCRRDGERAEAGTLKDAGDDPDVTHGALLYSQVRLVAEPGVRFVAGLGVGTVTRPGLVLAVGEPAINPVPRRMIGEHLQQLAQDCAYPGGFEVTVNVQDGEALALKTMNPRLGILGGLSILGTSGIVRPFSCSAYIASIHQGIDVAHTNGYRHIAACTGNASEDTMRRVYGLPEIAGWAADVGADAHLQAAIIAANTSQQALALAHAAGVALGDAVCAHALAFARSVVPAQVQVEVFAIDRQGGIVGKAGVQ